jgi:hypothetical protein
MQIDKIATTAPKSRKLVQLPLNYLGLWRLRLSALAYFLLPDLWAL